MFYKDGEIVGSGSGLYTGGTISSGGTIVIEQDQDTDIVAQYHNCSITQGSVNWWSQFKDDVQGDVLVVEP